MDSSESFCLGSTKHDRRKTVKRQKTNNNFVQHPTEISVVAKTAPEDDWQVNKPLGACLGYLLQTTHLEDVTFEFPNEDPVVKLKAHKLILAARSPVFEAMFYGLAGRMDQAHVIITDATSKTFEDMLIFLYTDEMPLTSSDYNEAGRNLLRISHKYRIDSLTDSCRSLLEDYLYDHNVLAVLELATLLDLSVLKQRCWMHIDQWPCEVFGEEECVDIELCTLVEIVKRDSLNITELELYRFCLEWAVAECGRQGIPATGENKKRVLGIALEHIRFPLMSSEEISDELPKHGVLTDKELLDLSKKIASKDEAGLERSVSTPRVYCSGEDLYVNRAVPADSEVLPIIRKETVKITVSEDVFWTGFEWDRIGSSSVGQHIKGIEGTITLNDGRNKTVHTEFDVFSTNKNRYTVQLLTSILLRKDVNYMITFDFTFSPESFFGKAKKFRLVNGTEVCWASLGDTSDRKAVNRASFLPWI